MQKLDCNIVHEIIEQYQKKYQYLHIEKIHALDEKKLNFLDNFRLLVKKNHNIFEDFVELLSHPFFLDKQKKFNQPQKDFMRSFSPSFLKKLFKGILFFKIMKNDLDRNNLERNTILLSYIQLIQRRSLIMFFLSKRLYTSLPIDAFLLSLFKESGHLFMILQDENYKRFFLDNYFSHSQDQLVEKENVLFSFNHLLLSYYFAQLWSLPACVTRTILTSEEVGEFYADKTTVIFQKNSMQAALYCSHQLALLLFNKGSLECFFKKVFENKSILKNLDISKDDFIALILDLWDKKEQIFKHLVI